VLQLGDFGLACPLEGEDIVRHDGFGTRLYAAAEQLQGKCCKKSDIYSLGVILIELLSKCITVMECFKKVEELKKGEDLSEIDIESCALIRCLLSQKPDKRPDIVDLKSIVQKKLETSSSVVDHLKKVISDKDDVIQQKEQQIGELMNEISKLRKQLSNS
jgi:serine/threonine protein kinase